MKTIKLKDPNDYDQKKLKAFIRQYLVDKGYETPVEKLPIDIVSEQAQSAIIAFAALSVRIGEEFLLEFPNLIGTLKCKKIDKFNILVDKDSMLELLEIPKDEPTMELLESLEKTHRVLAKDEPFKHPLAEYSAINGEQTMNDYGFAEQIIEAIRFPESTKDNGEKAEYMVKVLILSSGEEVNAEYLLAKIKTGHLREMMKASTLIAKGFNDICDRQLG